MIFTENSPTWPFIAGFTLGILVALVWFNTKDTMPEYLSNIQTITDTITDTKIKKEDKNEIKRDNSGAISVNNQVSGNSVYIESVTVPPPGVWVAVRDVNSSELGNVLGAVRINGPKSSVYVPLLRVTEAGTLYAVELYRDNGDNEFDLSADSVYVDFNTGEPVISYFTTEK